MEIHYPPTDVAFWPRKHHPESGIAGEIGLATLFALKWTDECVKYGRGKVYFFEKDEIYSGNSPKYAPESYVQLPDLFYTDHIRDEQSRSQWTSETPTQRRDALNVRLGALSESSLCMPISVFYQEFLPWLSMYPRSFQGTRSRMVLLYQPSRDLTLLAAWFIFAADSEIWPVTAQQVVYQGFRSCATSRQLHTGSAPAITAGVAVIAQLQ
ncbi:hypothetical protein H2200_005449 [Cladophialophora chaetospira]|uniref:Uncharacterized protein n=1 Tax=Cladophialophora chaetospira TaxID=386627 RepID=A0AA38XC81_9EURO|nr:hypothetical protein H2200_005449 [Cladophialophora chaetospira]